MKLGYIILYVDDVAATLDFYQRAFDQKKKFLTPEADYGELDAEAGPTLAFVSRELGRQMHEQGVAKVPKEELTPFEVAFVTENVEAAVEKALGAGAQLVHAAESKPWGQVVAFVKDCNGFLVELCTAVNPK